MKFLLVLSLAALFSYGQGSYIVVGGRSVMFVTVPMSWNEMKDYCNAQFGHLATVDDEILHHALVEKIKQLGYGGKSFWIGTKMNLGGNWVYDNSDLPAFMGTPFWGIAYDDVHQEPYEANPSVHPSFNACLYHVTFHHMHSCYNDARIGGICMQ